MLIIFGLLAAIIAAMVLSDWLDKRNSTSFCAVGLWTASVLLGAILLVAITSIPMARMDTLAKIRRLETTRITLSQQRAIKGTDYERATVINKILECNQRLATAKYYNGTAFDIWIPDEIEKVKPINRDWQRGSERKQ